MSNRFLIVLISQIITSIYLTVPAVAQDIAHDSDAFPADSTGAISAPPNPWFALKSNVLFDLALTPNIEVEVPLGRNNRWSVMVEDWFPWFLYDRNKAGDSNPYRKQGKNAYGGSYSVWMLGAEVRYWLGDRTLEQNAPLRGTFIGLYGAGGKYDWERDSKGEQGEYTSLGLSLGHVWRMSRRLNLELSAAVGYIGGPRRHYQGEFDDTHLIYRYKDHLRYIGPTKLKLSVVWMIGNRQRKEVHDDQ